MNFKLFLIPIAVAVISQGIKSIIDISKGKFTWSSLIGYGGMPSSHSALVTSLATVMGYYQGLDSPAFAIALILALLTMKDASGIRWHLGSQGKTINKLIKELPDEKEYNFPVLPERFGHKNTEIFAGILVGFILTFLAIWIL